jgi:hypothetical protein
MPVMVLQWDAHSLTVLPLSPMASSIGVIADTYKRTYPHDDRTKKSKRGSA